MGDDGNVTIRRIENSSPSSSPQLGAARTKNLDVRRIREVSMDDGESPVPFGPESGEPGGEGLRKITDHDDRIVDNDLLESEANDSKSPLIVSSPRGHVGPDGPSVFPFSETKLRPDAPPFTPESLARSDVSSPRQVVVGINDSVCGEPNYPPRSEIDDSCFVNVDLRSGDEAANTVTTPKVPPKPNQRIGTRDSRDHVKDPGLKPFSLTSTPRLKRSPPKIHLSVDSVRADVETNESVRVATEAGPDDPGTRDTEPEIGQPRAVRRHWRIMRTAFIIGNRIQIAVFIASVVLCVIIVAYVFV